MGTIGSKEKLSQIVVIYGYNSKDFPWRELDDRNVYQTSGLVISYNGKKYIITTRIGLIGCNNLVMYYSYFDDKQTILKNKLGIIFQSMEYNIMILGTDGKSELDLSMSDIITEFDNQNITCDSYDIINKKNSQPTIRSRYYTVVMDISMENSVVKHDVDIFDAKFHKSCIRQQSYLPSNYMYKFKLMTNNYENLCGVHGAVIFNKKLELVGMVTETSKDVLYVLPSRVLRKIVSDFLYYSHNPKLYCGIRTVPFEYKINKKMEIKVSKLLGPKINGNDKKNIKEKDQILSIGDKEVLIIKNDSKKNNILKAVIYDDEYRETIPLDIYFRLILKQDIPLKIVLKRNDKILETDIINIPYIDVPFKLSSQQYYFPKELLPFVNLCGVIITEITYELFNVLEMNDIKIKNNLLDLYTNDKLTLAGNYFIIIDCLNKDITTKYSLPQLSIDKKQTIICPTIKTINGKEITSLDEIKQNEDCILETIMPDGSIKNITIIV